jgi:hypothetical protein
MYSLFDPRFDAALVDETGCLPEFKPGTIFNCVMDNGPSPIPLFLKFLRRRSTPKTCMVCSKAIFDIDYGDVETWKATCGSFKGSWVWNLLLFPTRDIQQCDHDFEVCRACTAEHIRSSLTSGGPSACGSLSCPQCSKKLSYQEVNQLADAETVAKYSPKPPLTFPLKSNFLTRKPGMRNSFCRHFSPTIRTSAGVSPHFVKMANCIREVRSTLRSRARSATSRCVSPTKCPGTMD